MVVVGLVPSVVGVSFPRFGGSLFGWGVMKRALVPYYSNPLRNAPSDHCGISMNNPPLTANLRGGSIDSRSKRRFSHSSVSGPDRTPRTYRAYVAVGSNLGDRFGNIVSALRLLCDPEWQPSGNGSSYVRVVRTSFLHETAPMYVTEQPPFLNGAVELETDLPPDFLLDRIKRVERELGRDFDTMRNGPRPVDLDILLYDSIDDEGRVPIVLNSTQLAVPHPRIEEREFVLRPLCELGEESLQHPTLNVTMGELLSRLSSNDGMSKDDKPPVQILPLPRGRILHFNRTLVMGILNVTPDSFSDGGKLKGSVDLAVEEALQMEKDGADIIDIGGESTRPGAKEIILEEEIVRTIPVIQRIREVSDIPISIDTRHAQVAHEAVYSGADIVNDVSGGTFDPSMLSTVSQLGVAMVLMHMRGTPESMQSLTQYDDVVLDVARSLKIQCCKAEETGISRWLQVVDPGVGFAKDLTGNLNLLNRLGEFRTELSDCPILLGTSRKGFLGRLTGMEKASDRDYGTVASCVAALCLGRRRTDCNILRVHNVKAAKQAVVVMDAIVDL